MKIFRLLFFLFVLLFVACQSDEKLISILPEILPKDIAITYRLQEMETSYQQGHGVIIRDDSTMTNWYAVASDTFKCNAVEFHTQGVVSDFYISFQTFEDKEAESLYYGRILTIIENDTTLYFSNPGLTLACGNNIPQVVTIEEETEDFIRGTYEAEFFERIDLTTYGGSCDLWESVGLLNIDFAVPLSVCR